MVVALRARSARRRPRVVTTAHFARAGASSDVQRSARSGWGAGPPAGRPAPPGERRTAPRGGEPLVERARGSDDHHEQVVGAVGVGPRAALARAEEDDRRTRSPRARSTMWRASAPRLRRRAPAASTRARTAATSSGGAFIAAAASREVADHRVAQPVDERGDRGRVLGRGEGAEHSVAPRMRWTLKTKSTSRRLCPEAVARPRGTRAAAARARHGGEARRRGTAGPRRRGCGGLPGR